MQGAEDLTFACVDLTNFELVKPYQMVTLYSNHIEEIDVSTTLPVGTLYIINQRLIMMLGAEVGIEPTFFRS